MSRVHCPDCGIDVVVDPTGRCPDGHQLGAAGQRIAESIGTGPKHPDEPEPWVGRVTLDEQDQDDGVGAEVRPIRPPSVAVRDDGASEATRAETDELLQEFQSLGEDPAGSPSDGDDDVATASELEAAVHQLSPEPEPAPRPEPAPSPRPEPAARPEPAPSPRPEPRSDDDLSHLDGFGTAPPAAAPNGHHTNGEPTASSPDATGDEDASLDRWQALADVAALAKDRPAPSTQTGHGDLPSPPPPPPAPPPPAAATSSRRGRGRRTRGGDGAAALDVTNFTAHGAKVGSRGRRRGRGD